MKMNATHLGMMNMYAVAFVALCIGISILAYHYYEVSRMLRLVPKDAYFKTCSEIESIDELLEQLAMGNTRLDGPDEDNIPCNSIFERELDNDDK